ncbi:MAG: hypothetical protein GVY10_05655 [Verrucomicrobia bacterium]|jgi:hypothetical protein|nr:hypothetical protein [Verrucomicrobiota bacterium]
MKKTILLTAIIGAGTSACFAQSLITPGDTAGMATYTTPDGKVTMTSMVDSSPSSTFSTAGNFIGVEGGSNPNAVDTRDWEGANTPEGISMDFASDVGLSQIVFKWYGGDVTISGFTADPLATGMDSTASNSLRDISYSGGTLSFRLDGNWTGTATLDLDNLNASADSTLMIAPVPNDGGGIYTSSPRFSITEMSYQVVPEPGLAAVAFGALALFFVVRQRRRA